MKILHICLAGDFYDNYNYQENALTKQNKLDGHEVFILAAAYNMVTIDNKVVKIYKQEEYVNEDGNLVIRLKYKNILFELLTNKLKMVKDLYKYIENIRPDVIMFHGTSSLELDTVGRYKKNHPNIKFYMDSHTDYYTSATNIISKKLLHGIIYRKCIKRNLKYMDKIFYISVSCGTFLENEYKIPKEKMEFYSLGGQITSRDERKKCEEKIRSELRLKNDDIILVQAGKFDQKKKVLEFLEVFDKIENKKLHLLIIGSIAEDIEKRFFELVEKDDRIIYLGWKNSNQLNEYLKGCDIYVQPGKASAIVQNAICCGCAVILNNLVDYRLFVDGNGWLIDEVGDIKEILTGIKANDIKDLKVNSASIAAEYFDYKKLAERLYRM